MTQWKELDDVFRPSILSGDDLGGLLERSLSQTIVVAENNVLSSILETADMKSEIAGVLLGTAHTISNSNCYLTHIHQAVEGEGSERSPVHVRFTSLAWDAIGTAVKDTSETIVGWYHTHPGLGVFMSGTDKRTQRYFFSQPWQISLVVDPVDQNYGFFAGEESVKVHGIILR